MDKRTSELVIGAAFSVSNNLGCGFLESVYENALAIELQALGVPFLRQKSFDIQYRGCWAGHYVADLVVADDLIVEVKAVSRLILEHHAQLLNYLRASGLTVGLLLNFGRPKVEIKRLVRAAPE